MIEGQIGIDEAIAIAQGGLDGKPSTAELNARRAKHPFQPPADPRYQTACVRCGLPPDNPRHQ
jgi:hypothetical protein